MDDARQCHEALLQQRTQIRHHKNTLQWMKRCWKAFPHANDASMSLDEYEDMYSMLLYEMTVCWEEELNDAILSKMWTRDAASHDAINFERFCCSLFFFAEMWVEDITLQEYERIFCHVHLIGVGQEHLSPTRRGGGSGAFKPTLESYSNALDNEKSMEELHMNFGKSILFDAEKYYHHFGAPTAHLQAFQATLLQMQSRARVSEVATPSGGYKNQGRCVSASPSRQATTFKTVKNAPGATLSPPSPSRNRMPSNPVDQTVRPCFNAQRPMSSSGRVRYMLDEDGNHGLHHHNSAHSLPPPTFRSLIRSPPQSAGKSPVSGDSFILTGRSMVASPKKQS